jgi:hypothetical protein
MSNISSQSSVPVCLRERDTCPISVYVTAELDSSYSSPIYKHTSEMKNLNVAIRIQTPPAIQYVRILSWVIKLIFIINTKIIQ